MSDAQTQLRERLGADPVRILVGAMRDGRLSERDVALAAALGDEAALAIGLPPAMPPEYWVSTVVHIPADHPSGETIVHELPTPEPLGPDPWDWPEATLDDATWRLWACDCAERELWRVGVTEERPWEAVRVSRRYAVEEATGEELAAARDLARGAAWGAALEAARSAAWDAARSAAWDAAWTIERAWQRQALADRLLGREVAL